MPSSYNSKPLTTDISHFKKYIPIGALAFLALITLLTAIRSVDTGKIGVVTSYGKVTGRELSEGLSWVAPWGVNNVTVYDIKTQKVEAQSEAASKDLQNISATVVLTYNLNRGKVSEVHQGVGKDFQSIEIDPQVQEAFKAVSAKYTASELITNRAQVKADVVKNLQDRVEKNGRYNIQDVAITNFKFSAAFDAAIESVQVANRNIEKARQELETTRVESEKRIAEATAAAEAQRLQQQTLSPLLIQKQWIEKWDGKLPTTATGDSTIFSIPKP